MPERRNLVLASLGVKLGAAADQVGEEGDGRGVAHVGKAFDAEGVEVVAREEGEVGVVSRQAGEACRNGVGSPREPIRRRRNTRPAYGSTRGPAADEPAEARFLAWPRPRAGRSGCPPHAVAAASRRRASVIGATSARDSAAASRVRSIGRLIVGEGDEPSLELGRRRIDAVFEHGAAEAGVGFGVAGLGGGEIADRSPSLKKRVTRPGAEATWSGRPSARLGEAGGETIRQLAEALVGGSVECRGASPTRLRRQVGCPRECLPGRRRRPGQPSPSTRAARRRLPREARRRGPCRGSSGPGSRRRAPGRRRERRESR